MRFEREFTLPHAPAAVWELLWDVERMVACVPGCTGATVIEPGRRYQATIVEKVGPFKLEVPLDIEIAEAEAARSMRLRAAGKDKRIGTEVRWELALELTPVERDTRCRMTVDAEVVGRLVSLGQGVIKLKGDQTMGRFAEALQANFNQSGS